MAVRFSLNGAPVEVRDIDPHVTLLQWLRESGRTGTKEGCAEGECGACAVALLRAGHDGRTRFEAINSCLFPLVACEGATVVTVEGIAGEDGSLHPVQRALVERGGSQCGYCTPGFVVSLFCEYYRPERSEFDAEAISGNLCRCTGYRPIVDAARELPRPANGDSRLVQLGTAPASPGSFAHQHSGFAFHRPASLEEALRLLSTSPGATLLAGGTDLMVYANQRFTRFRTLIALDAVPELRAFERTETELTIGAALPLAHLEQRLAALGEPVPLLAQLLPLFSSRLIRQRATLGGNLGTASPIGDSPPVLLALDAELIVANASRSRRVSLGEFFLDYRKTRLEPDELVVAVHLPLPVPALQRFYKVSKRVLDDISTVSAAFAAELGPGGRVTKFRAAFGGVAATPVRALELEAAVQGQVLSPELVARAAPLAGRAASPIGDHRGSRDYRVALVTKLFERFVFEVSAPAEAAE